VKLTLHREVAGDQQSAPTQPATSSSDLQTPSAASDPGLTSGTAKASEILVIVVNGEVDTNTAG
jgi:hypothetical protein